MTTIPGLTSLVRSDVPAGAYDDHLTRVLPQARDQRVWEPADGPLPSLFVSHGAPFTLDDPDWIGDLFTWAQSLPKPRAIVVVSAHWERSSAAISGAAAGTPLYYDFSGFHPRYKTLPYASPDATDGRYTLATLTDAGRAKVVSTAPAHVAEVRRLVFDSLGPTRRRSVGPALARIAASVRRELDAG